MRLNELFCDGVVFQANKPIRVFGTGGGRLKIIFCGNKIDTDFFGTEWEIELPPMDYGGPYKMEIDLDGRRYTLNDIYIGDVYVIAGQSNMQFKLKESDCNMNLYSTDSLLRLFSSERPEGGERFFPQDGWIRADKDNVGDWSSLGYMVGMMLREKNNHAVGLLTCYQGAADIQSYMPDSAFDNPYFSIPDEERLDINYPWNKGHSQLYNFQLRRLAPFSVSSVIWYQGESNASERASKVYGEMLSCLIHSWRIDFKDELLPFVVVQIADFIGRDFNAWNTVQHAQAEIEDKEQNVKTVISRDICENTDIHPKNKYELAKRISQAI